MIKKLSILLVLVALILTGCDAFDNVPTDSSASNETMFVDVEVTHSWRIVYHKTTKVMYNVSQGASNYGNFTVLVNGDGTPMVYGEDYIK